MQSTTNHLSANLALTTNDCNKTMNETYSLNEY